MSHETECPQCAAGVCSAHQPEPTPAELAAAYPWALRVVRYDDEGRLPGHDDDDPNWFPPRSSWGPGPWVGEPDLIEWRSVAVPPYPLIILRGGMGQLNGYVGVPPSHPLHGESRFPYANWTGPCEGKRIPTGEPPDCWWFGFDCAGPYELCPLQEAGFRFIHEFLGVPPPEFPSTRMREKTYVTVEECRIRAEALAVVLKALDTREALEKAFGSAGIPVVPDLPDV